MTNPLVTDSDQTGIAYTDPDGGRYQGDWQLTVMNPVLVDAATVSYNMYAVVDSQGRVVAPYNLAARTATPTAYPIYTRGTQGVAVTIKATAKTGTPSVTVSVQAYDPGSATYITLLTSAAITDVSTTRLMVAPGITPVSNVAADMIIGDTIKIVATHADSINSLTYSIGLDWQ